MILSDGNRVTASDEPTLIGTDTTANELLRRIRSSGEAETLVYAGRKGLTRYYGMYSHGATSTTTCMFRADCSTRTRRST